MVEFFSGFGRSPVYCNKKLNIHNRNSLIVSYKPKLDGQHHLKMFAHPYKENYIESC